MTAQVNLYNLALGHLGKTRVTAVTEPNGIKLDAFFENARDAVLALHPWNFATVRAELAADDTAPVFGWDTYFTLPADPYCLRVVGMTDDASADDVDEDAQYAIEAGPDGVGRKIATNLGAPLYVKYIFRVTDYSLWSPLAIRLLGLQLAADAAIEFTNSLNLQAKLLERIDNERPKAKNVDAQEHGAEVDDDSDYLEARA